MPLSPPTLQLRFDMRAPAFGAQRELLYRAALAMSEYADYHGFTHISLSEHHGVEDGYLPSSPTLAAAIAARTQRIRLMLSAIVVPLHDPLRLAEELAVLDLISGGRVTLVAVAGYVKSEFALFGKAIQDRVRLLESAIETLRLAWSGEPFEYQGRRVLITPKPQQAQLPIFMGGSVAAAARRAARLADGFITHIPALYEIYFNAATELGKFPAPFVPAGIGCVFVAEDPEVAWKRLAPHALYEMNAYARWSDTAGTDSGYIMARSVDDLKASGGYAVLTPAECIELVREQRNIFLHPLVGGLDPELGWRSLKLFVEKVLPNIR